MTNPILCNLGNVCTCALLTGLFLQTAARSETYYVDQNHPRADDANRGTDEANPWRTLEHAFQTVKPGDTAYVKGSAEPNSPAAVYHTAGKAGFAIRTPGEKEKPISFVAAEGHTVIVEGSMSGFGIDLTNASHHIFRGFVIRKFNKATEGRGATGVLIERCEFAQTRETGLRLRDVSDFTMRDCYVHHCWETGISIRSGRNVSIERVESSYNSDNRGAEGDGDGFHTYGGENIAFIDCVARGNSEDGFDLNADVTLRNCVSSGHTACNIKLWRRKGDDFAPKTMLVINCLVYGAKEAGIKVSEGASLQLYNSVVHGNGEEGVAFRAIKHDKGPSEITSRLVNSIIANNVGPAIGVLQQPPNRNRVLADHNLYFGNKRSSFGLDEDSNAVVDKDPLFFAPRVGDFHLKTGSPAIDAGVALEAVTVDREGRKRPFGTAPDIGAFERMIKEGNRAPAFVRPEKIAFDIEEGETLRLNLDAKDAEGHQPVFLLSGHFPRQMSISRDTGEFVFSPTFEQGGNNKEPSEVHKVTALVTDRHYAFPADTVELTVTVHNVNRPPAYRGLPTYTLIAGRPFLLTLDIDDPDEGDCVSKTLTHLPAGAKFDPDEGEVCWVPSRDQVGIHRTELAISDGMSTEKSTVAFEVLPATPYVPPVDPENLFHVDAHKGSDDNDGKTEKTAWKSIQQAADTLEAGQMVLIRQGTYFEQVMPKSDGQPDAMIVYKAYPGERPILDGMGEDQSPEAFKGASHMVLDGLTFRNYSETIDLRGNDLENIVVVNCAIRGSRNYGIYGWTGDRLRVENVVMEDLHDRAFYGGGTNVHLHNVSISRVNDRGISVSGWQYDNINILDSEISGAYCGILANAKNMLIMNCTLRGNKGMGIWAPGKNVHVINCILSGTTMRSGSAANIALDRNTSVQILNCVLAGSERFGLYVHDETRHCRLINSIICDSKDLEVRGFDLPSLDEDHNVLYDRNENLAPRGASTKVVDPKFVRARMGDFRLQPDSPAIDAGTALEQIKTDIEGTPRPQGKGYDIGAHEHTPAGTGEE